MLLVIGTDCIGKSNYHMIMTMSAYFKIKKKTKKKWTEYVEWMWYFKSNFSYYEQEYTRSVYIL